MNSKNCCEEPKIRANKISLLSNLPIEERKWEDSMASDSRPKDSNSIIDLARYNSSASSYITKLLSTSSTYTNQRLQYENQKSSLYGMLMKTEKASVSNMAKEIKINLKDLQKFRLENSYECFGKLDSAKHPPELSPNDSIKLMADAPNQRTLSLSLDRDSLENSSEFFGKLNSAKHSPELSPTDSITLMTHAPNHRSLSFSLERDPSETQDSKKLNFKLERSTASRQTDMTDAPQSSRNCNKNITPYALRQRLLRLRLEADAIEMQGFEKIDKMITSKTVLNSLALRYQ